ncbi:peptidoglycan glycosyltransferase /cell elongation-specific peptidoglycan D,D-transpeptidase [Verrucomicrobium sp. GAS474]|uniref:penicillin-binding transpeptidase domain-containing protein n=1 Tax=Verrucomicrobium sp. GAS474 TaxID=1882831 RepID=UPI0008792E25|nr:penicillin-binding transpeptidase domain-containing protein [Verrucomicrobium sp. GAS474]SDT95625.1 peptidoglycan glycosyltransferase /cell elongation-specific peptidoglycan D,D-transpeptidase [Verrucomicrobium sp. GAS474]
MPFPVPTLRRAARASVVGLIFALPGLAQSQSAAPDPSPISAAAAAPASVPAPSPARDADTPNPIPRIIEYRLPALRGNIVTSEGDLLASTVATQNLVLAWPSLSLVSTAEAASAWAQPEIARAAQWLGTPPPAALTDDVLQKLYAYRRFQPIIVSESLTPQQIAAFPASGLAQAGFALQDTWRRSYPMGDLGVHLVGTVKRTQARSRGPYHQGEVGYSDYKGGSGLEEAFNTALRGTDGRMTIRTTADGLPQSTTIPVPPTAGNTVRTTLRTRIQQEAESTMKAVPRGAMIILDARTGDVVASVSRPGYDPNAFLPAVSPELWSRLSEDPARPLLNRVTFQQQPPGSTFKLVTSLAALRAGVLDPNDKFTTNGTYKVGNVEYHIPDEVGTYAYREALAHSINIYFFRLGLMVGRDNLVSTAKELGIGRPTGFVLGDAPGRMPDEAYVLANHQRSFGPGDVTNTAIGQGDVLMTPIQIAHLAELIANEGAAFEPRLVSAIEDGAGHPVQEFPPKPEPVFPLPAADWKTLKSAMQAVTEIGTGVKALPDGTRLSGKTGTAQVGTKEEPRQIAWFMGYVPSDNPQYAFVVMVEGSKKESLWGADAAAPLINQVFSVVYAKRAVPIGAVPDTTQNDGAPRPQ